MIEFLNDLLQASLAGTDLEPKDLLWGGLVAGLVFSVIHLLTMLVTRWGDRKANSKAFLFSLLVHVCCLLGVVAVNPPENLAAFANSEARDETKVRVRKIDTEDQPPSKDLRAEDQPVWERVSKPVETQVARLERDAGERLPRRLEREREDVRPEEIDARDVTLKPARKSDTPQPEQMASSTRRFVNPDLPAIRQPDRERRPDVASTPTSDRRVRTGSPLGRLPEEISRRPIKGDVDQFGPVRASDTRPEVPTDVPSPRALVRNSPVGPNLRQRSGPLPTPAPTIEPGTVSDSATGAATVGAPGPMRLAGNRDGGTDRDGGDVERVRPGAAPTARPRIDDGVAYVSPSTGPRPTIDAPQFDRPAGDPVPRVYKARDPDQAKRIAKERGGTDRTERAVKLSLQWLAKVQHENGYWDADQHESGQVKVDENGIDRLNAGKEADTGVTGLALLAFLARGYTSDRGPYKAVVGRGLDWLLEQQRDDGFLGGNATHYARTYCHAIATYALAEATAMQSDPTEKVRLRAALRKAVDYIVRTQNPEDGGWRYRPYFRGQKSDTSIFGWMLMALYSAKVAGVDVPEETNDRMITFLRAGSLGRRNGLAAYRTGERPSPAMTAEALFCKQRLGIRRSNPASIEAVEYLLQNLPQRAESNLYYWYYGTLSMFHYGGKPWKAWNESLRDLLVQEQVTTGDQAGSWHPRGRWGQYGGRVYSTALSTLCLETYYRELPLYKQSGSYDEE